MADGAQLDDDARFGRYLEHAAYVRSVRQGWTREQYLFGIANEKAVRAQQGVKRWQAVFGQRLGALLFDLVQHLCDQPGAARLRQLADEQHQKLVLASDLFGEACKLPSDLRQLLHRDCLALSPYAAGWGESTSGVQ